MKLNYPRDEFYAHQRAWDEHFHHAESVTFGGKVHRVGVFLEPNAYVFRMLALMSSTGITDEWEAREKSRVFTSVQMYLKSYSEELRRGGLIRLHDGQQAVATPECLQAIYEAFLDDPPADPRLVTVESVIARGKELQQHP